MRLRGREELPSPFIVNIPLIFDVFSKCKWALVIQRSCTQYLTGGRKCKVESKREV